MPTKPCCLISRIMDRVYAVGDKAGGALRTLGVLQAYWADLLDDLDQGDRLERQFCIFFMKS